MVWRVYQRALGARNRKLDRLFATLTTTTFNRSSLRWLGIGKYPRCDRSATALRGTVVAYFCSSCGCGVMRTFLLATAALIVLTGPAISADMRGPVSPIVPARSWTDCHVGGHAGGLWAKSTEWVVRCRLRRTLRTYRRTRPGQQWATSGSGALWLRTRRSDAFQGAYDPVVFKELPL